MEQKYPDHYLDWEECFDTINDAITIHDRDFNIIRANKAAQEVLQTSLLHLSGKKCFELYHGTSCPPEDCPSCRVLTTGQPVIVETYEPHLGKFLEIKALPRISRSNQLEGVIHIVRDISNRKKAEAAEQNLQAQLLQAQKMESIGALAGGIAHDFNNLLSAILGYSELILLKLPEGDPLKKDIKIIHEAGERAASLTKQLLIFSRKQVLETKVINLNSIVENMAKMLQRLLREDMVLEVRTKSPLTNILADPDQIGQILMNLVINARDAMPRGGRITIETRDFDPTQNFPILMKKNQEGPYILLSVSDNGVGIDPEIRERIFEPFFTTKGTGKGTGLGLATVYGIVNQHNGHIQLQSAPGEGSIFNIFLPITTEAVIESRTYGPEEIPGGSETILVAEDDPAIRRVILDTLHPLGYRVITAASGEEALNLSRKNGEKIDLLLTDVMMPGINGKKLADQLSLERPALKVLFMSGYFDDAIKEQGLSVAEVDYIQKPISFQKLTRRVREILDRPTPSSPVSARN